MEVSVIGISHRTAPVEVREKFALPGELARELLRAIHAESIFSEVLVLDTCNRTEVYFVPSDAPDPMAVRTDLPELPGRLEYIIG